VTLLPEYNQQHGEKLLDWKYRLIFGKAKKDVKLSWDEISELLGIGCSGEYLRKIAYGVLEYAEHQKSKYKDTDKTPIEQMKIDDMESKRLTMEREKMRMQDQKRELNNLLREYARAEHIKEEIKTAVAELANSKPLTVNIKVTKSGTREAVLLLSDWHKGQNIANHWNLFNDVEFKRRIETLVSKAIAYCHENNVRRINVFALGDMINGLIRATARINNTEDSIRQVMAVSETLAGILIALAEEFDEVRLFCSRGNHDRVTPNIKESISKESFFDIIPWFLQARLGHIKAIQIVPNEYDDEIIVTEICGQTVFGVHGNRDKVGNVVQNLALMIKKFPDVVVSAHLHHNIEDEIHGCDVVVNSCLCGTDNYAKEIRATAKAAQKLLIFDSNEGRLCTYNIKL
jgi:hypothetical protein